MVRAVNAAGAAGPERPSGWPTAHRAAVLYGTAGASLAGIAGCFALARVLGVGLDPVGFAIAVAAFAGSQVIRLRVRVGREEISIGWVEVGVTAAWCLVPPVWAPVAVFLGAVLALGPRLARARAGMRAGVLFAIGAMVIATLAGSAGAGLASGAGTPLAVDLQRPVTLGPLVLAGVLNFVTGTTMTATWLGGGSREPLPTVWLRVARAKRMILAGTAAVSAATAILISVNRAWLLALVPVVWILHRAYVHQMRSGQARATWATLADATRGLNQLDERGVALAALRGAARLFGPEIVDVSLQRPRGTVRTYRARASDLVSGQGAEHVSTVDEVAVVVDPGPHRRVVTHRLAVGGHQVGEIRLYLRRSAAFSESDQHAFSAFADAAASALHDAATHRTLRAMTARSAYDALHDSLTGLPNRSTVVARGNAELRRVAGPTPVALVVVDVEGLREVNESLGYSAGDEVLQVVARRLLERQLDGELIGRLGGDEFVILLLQAPDTGSSEPCEGYALDRARWLRADLAVPTQVGGCTIAVEASMGVVVATAGGCDMAELLRRADVALHQAKLEPGRLARYDARQDPANTDRLALLADLRDALAATDQFLLHVQPTVDLETGRPVEVEVLSRWDHPRRGLLEPADYIAVVEHSDLAGAFTLHTLDLALRLISDWASQGLHLPVSVNLCARCTSNPDLPMLVADRLTTHGVAPQQLILEITESVAMADADLAEQVVAGLRRLGVRVCVDNFGTGSASLSFLARFPVDEVKIDRTFVATMVDSPETAAIVKATVDVAHDLGMRVVAEGVERPEQRAALLELGVTAAQGFLFHRPMPAREAAPVLQGRTQAAEARHIPIVRASPPLTHVTAEASSAGEQPGNV
jgi:diguanylate cyclase (GGDEF)-like protein